MDFHVRQQGSLGWGVGALDELFRPVMSLLHHTVSSMAIFFTFLQTAIYIISVGEAKETQFQSCE